MDDAARNDTDQLHDSTRWLLVVVLGAAVLAAGVIAATDVPDLVGRRWQAVGAASGALTVIALLVGLLVVLRALDPLADEEPVEAADVVERLPETAPVDEGQAGDSDVDAGDSTEATGAAADPVGASGVEGPEPEPEPSPEPAVVAGAATRRVHRHAVHRFHRTRSLVGIAVVVAFLGMVGMTVAAVADGNKVEERARRALQTQLQADQDGPITEPQPVAVQFTTPGLRRVAEAMNCTGADIGARPVQGWAVSGTFRNPTVVLFAPVPACDNTEIALAPRDGFVYPTVGVPTTTTTTTTAPTPTTGQATALTPTTAAPAAP